MNIFLCGVWCEQFLILLCQQDAHQELLWHALEEFLNAYLLAGNIFHPTKGLNKPIMDDLNDRDLAESLCDPAPDRRDIN